MDQAEEQATEERTGQAPGDRAAAQDARAGTACLRLPDECTIFEAAAVHRDLCARVRAGGPVTMDAGGVTVLDVSMLQLLAAARKACADRGVAFTLEPCSRPVREALALVGCASLLEPVRKHEA